MTSIHAKSVQTKAGTETELAQHIFMGCPQLRIFTDLSKVYVT